MNEQLDRLACPACNSPIDSSNVARVYVAPFNQKEYSLHNCASCDLGFWTPLEILPEFYEGEGYAAYEDYHSAARPFPPWARSFFEKKPVQSGRLLDVGCGDGSFLSAARSNGFDCFGIDLDEKSIRSAAARFCLEHVLRSPLDAYIVDCRKQGVVFDVITFFEVLEHQDHPAAFLEQVLSVLRPGGWIAGSVPNARRFLANVDRRISAGDLPPHHFLWFSPKTLKSFFHRHQLTSVLIYPSGNITFRELQQKLTALLLGMLGAKKTHWLAKVLIAPIAIPGAVLLWLGYRGQPAHLYFQARKAPGPA